MWKKSVENVFRRIDRMSVLLLFNMVTRSACRMYMSLTSRLDGCVFVIYWNYYVIDVFVINITDVSTVLRSQTCVTDQLSLKPSYSISLWHTLAMMSAMMSQTKSRSMSLMIIVPWAYQLICHCHRWLWWCYILHVLVLFGWIAIAISAYGLMMSVRPSVCPSVCLSVRPSVCQHFG